MKKIQFLGLLFTAAVTYAQSTSENYIHAKTCLSGDCSKKTETITYFDGLGRAKQLMNVKATITGKDLVTPVTYDEFGRQTKDILPVPVNTLNAAIHTGIVNENTANSYYGSGNAYVEKQIENSPLDRILQQAHAGDAWKMSAGHTIRYKYEVNGSNEVKKFITSTTTIGTGTVINTVSSLSVATDGGGFYNAGILYKNTVTDEDGTPVIQFQNGLGQVVLTRRTDGTQKIDTYYVYNEYGRKTFVIPPKAVQQIEQNNNNITPAVLESLCYQYRYDGQGREVEKRLPGRDDWESVVYDGADRAVLTQDAKQKKQGQWMLTKYDPFGRIAYTGLINGGSRTTMQGLVGSQVVSETQTPLGFSKSGITVYYTNNFLSDFTTALMVNYYDSYPRDMKEAPPVKILDQFVVNPNRDANGGISTISLPTATYIKNTENDSWTKAYSFYDTKGRKIGENSWNHLGGSTKRELKLDFAGQPEESYTYHQRSSNDATVKIKERFIYDNQNRLLKQYHQVDTQPEELLAENTYNDLGQLINKKTGNTTGTPLQSIDYAYNIRGWVTKMNDPVDLSGKLFAYELRYENPEDAGPARYSGNIAELDWTYGSGGYLRRYAYKYDRLNRLRDAVYSEPTATTPVNNGYSEYITYDPNGNIQTLKRFQAYNNTPMLIDDLQYSVYEGNRLKQVSDLSTNDLGYPTGGTTIDYDANGNMISHLDKGIEAISYNYLNLPQNVKFTEYDDKLDFLYRADGVKQKKAYSRYASKSGLTLVTTTDYLDGFQYLDEGQGAVLQFFPTAEGYFDFQKKRYIYNYQDHLGNIRLAYYRGSNNEAVTDREMGYYPFGMEYNTPNLSQLPSYSFGFQGQERQKETGWSSFKWRNAIPELGRFFNVDPLSEKYDYQSHYNFSENKIVSHRELEGLEAIDANKVREAFNTGKTGKSYQLVIHVDQPGKGGDRDTYEYNKGTDPGHAFVTLNRRNTDGTTDSKTFGYYPYPQSVNPLASEENGKIRDNFGHEQEVVQTRGITEKNFNDILNFVESKKNTRYDLNINNCTDFVINVAAVAGIKLPRTKGTWPNGGGVNPGDLGQDLRKQNERLRDGKSPDPNNKSTNKKDNDKKIGL